MNSRQAEFRQRLLATFKVEAAEHVQAMSGGLVELEQSPPPGRQHELIESIFRAAHSLKGSARAVDLGGMETVCHALESLLAAIKRQELGFSPGLFDLLHQAVDRLDRLLGSEEAAGGVEETVQIAGLVSQLEAVLAGDLPAPPAPPGSAPDSPPPVAAATPPMPATPETLRVSAGQLDSLLRRAEELLLVKQSLAQHVVDLTTLHQGLAEWKQRWAKTHHAMRSVEGAVEGAGQATSVTTSAAPLRTFFEFAEWNQTFVRSIEHALVRMRRTAEQDQRAALSLMDTILSDVKEVLTLPFSSVLEALPKLVRDLARDCGKEVDLAISGAELAVDRRVLDEIRQPLIHAIRNAIDHGIEKPGVRKEKGKPVRGRLTIEITPKDGNKAEVMLADDGAGIDLAKVQAAAVKLGLVGAGGTGLDRKEAVDLAFQSGVSTSTMVTDLSGRGLGLTIVRERIEKMGGSVSVETERDRGTIFRFVLPLTLATFRGVLLRVEDRFFILPTTHVERVLRLDPATIHTVENRETIALEGATVALTRLRDALEIPAARRAADANLPVPALLINGFGQRVAVIVDEIFHEQEVLVKPLGRQLARVPNVAGASVLGDGRVVPILHVADLVPSAIRAAASPSPAGPASAAPAAAAPPKAVLIVEDSITARSLLKNILASAGYEAVTAVDGLDALTKLREQEFDLVVSDVEMPRMNGFDLTARLRADPRLAELPVVLLTALESREDRERGVDVGASAYIVKSSFDQGNLLDVVRRLV